jgi:membrane-bound metal-dependent hydrolase YbcI (DUF457 family)
MPFTPFHFGPGAALHAIAPKRISFWAFCGANVLIDIEPLYYMLTHQYPLHRFFHTYIGATIMVGITTGLFFLMLLAASRLNLRDWFKWQSLTMRAILAGAVLGGYSHVLLDSLMHDDIAPLAPFSATNHLQGLVPLGATWCAAFVLRRLWNCGGGHHLSAWHLRPGQVTQLTQTTYAI